MQLILDANLLARNFYERNKSGDAEQVLYLTAQGFARRCERLAEAFPGHKLLAVFDNGKPTFRHAMCSEYKADRTPDALKDEALRACWHSLKQSKWSRLVAPDGYEADDMMASLAEQYEGRSIVHSSDKDLNCVLSPKTGIVKKSGFVKDENERWHFELNWFTRQDFADKYGFPLDRFLDYQCLCGDSADNVKGAHRIGEKMAPKVIQWCVENDKTLEDTDPFVLKFNKAQLTGWVDFLKRVDLLRDLLMIRKDLTI